MSKMIKTMDLFIVILALVHFSTSTDVYTADDLVPLNKDDCNANSQFEINPPLRVGSWKTSDLETKKLETSYNIIADIVTHYDIIAIEVSLETNEMEIIDISKAVNKKVHMEEDKSKNLIGDETVIDTYKFFISDQSKNKYAILYRKDKVSINASMRYEDAENFFQYDPFIVVFNTPTLDVDRVPLILVQISRENTAQEMNYLRFVYDYVREKLLTEDALIMGEVYSGCSAPVKNHCLNLKILKDDRFDWLLNSGIDVKAEKTSATNDRIILAGPNISKVAYPKSARTIDIGELLRNKSEDAKIFNYNPVEIRLKGKTHTSKGASLRVTALMQQTPVNETIDMFKSCTGITPLEQKLKEKLKNCSGETPIDYMLDRLSSDSNYDTNESCGEVVQTIKSEINEYRETVRKCFARPTFVFDFPGGTSMLGFVHKTLPEVYKLLELAHKSHPCIFSKETISILRHKADMGVLRDSSLYMQEKEYKNLEVFCIAHKSCSMSIAMALNLS